MDKYIIEGGKPLNGAIELHGSKNSVLPILAASSAINAVSVIHNCPDISDVNVAVTILEHLGCKVKREGSSITVDARTLCRNDIPEALMRRMRSSIIFLGALTARTGGACVTAPGGCNIGLRPIDLHLSALRTLGITVTESGGKIECNAANGIVGANVDLGFPSVGATENIMLASLGTKDEINIINAAKEPEIADLANFLAKCGAKIRGAGQGVMNLSRSERLVGTEHEVIPDRIVASTYMACAACCGGSVDMGNVVAEHLMPVVPVFEEAGCTVTFSKGRLKITAPERPKRIRHIRTMPYPGFPTDSQALITAIASRAEGTSIITERIFENRFGHVPELIKMGADIRVEDGCVAVVEGVERLTGANVTACDLRAGGALIAAALCAQGTTVIDGVEHIDRGYQDLSRELSCLAANIKRCKF